MRITIKKKLITGFGILLLLFVVFGIVVLSDMADVQKQFSFVVEHDAPVIANANRLLKLVVDMETGQRGFCITHKEKFLEPYNTANDEFIKLLETEKKLVSDNPSQEKVLESIHNLVDQWHEKAAKPEIAMARKLATAKNINEHNKVQKELASLLSSGTGKDLVDKIRAEFAVFIRTEEQLTKQRYANASQITLKTRNTTLLLVIFSVIFSSIITALSVRAIISPIRKLLNGTKIIGDGDLKHRIDINSKDEIGQLAISFNQMVDKREQTEGHLQAANQQLQAGEQQLRVANQQLRAGEQHLRAANQQLESEITERKQAEEELQETLAEIEQFNKLMIGREGRVIEMKKEVNALLAELGRQPQYKSALEDETVVSSDKAE